MQKPFDDAPAGEHDLTEISNHIYWKKDGEWWVTVLFESLSGEYENNKSQVTLEATWTDCQAAVDSGSEEENLVLTYARGLEMTDKNRRFLAAVAQLAGKPTEDLFPLIGTKRQVTTKSKATTHGVVVETCQKCDVDHKDYSNYKEEESDYYFREGGKWFGSECKGKDCKKIIGTKDGNFKPRTGRPVYVCRKYHLDKTNCAAMVCFDCVFKSDKKPRSRGNKYKTDK